jgi:hypothetical protein
LSGFIPARMVILTLKSLTCLWDSPWCKPPPASPSFAQSRVISSTGIPRHDANMLSLSGQVEIGIGDGTVRRLGPGDVMLAEDLTGQGHTTRAVGNEPRLSAAIPLT